MKLITSENIVGIICRTLNQVDMRLINHGARVAFLVMKMMDEENVYEDELIQRMTFLAMLHDIGAYKTEEINNMLEFETTDIWDHSIYGYLFLKYLSPFSDLAPVILYHHVDECRLNEIKTPYETFAQYLNIADRVDVYLTGGGDQEGLAEYLEKGAESRFSGNVLSILWRTQSEQHIFERLSEKSCLDEIMERIDRMPFTEKDIDGYLRMLIYTIDFRSPFTVIHTITTTKISMELGKILNVGEEDLSIIRYGALLHDMGKIGIPVEILEYPGKLSPQAMKIMKTHVDLTEKIFDGMIQEDIARIALRHHEKLDGSGYPRGLTGEQLTMNERIVAVADIVSALSGRRSYKEAFDKDKILKILVEMGDGGLLCPVCVEGIITRFDEIMQEVSVWCKPILEIYNHINEEFVSLKESLQMPVI